MLDRARMRKEAAQVRAAAHKYRHRRHKRPREENAKSTDEDSDSDDDQGEPSERTARVRTNGSKRKETGQSRPRQKPRLELSTDSDELYDYEDYNDETYGEDAASASGHQRSNGARGSRGRVHDPDRLPRYPIHREVSPPDKWPAEVCTYACSLRDVPANADKILNDHEPTVHLLRMSEPWHCVEVRLVPPGHPLEKHPTPQRGVFATCDIPAGTCLFEYTGEIVSANPDISLEEPFCMWYAETQDIDAARYGNESRFVNDASQPCKLGQVNAIMEHAYTRDGACILVVTTRRIRKGTEILVDYGESYHSVFSTSTASPPES